MPEKKQKPKRPEHDSANPPKPEREDIEAELPRAPVTDPMVHEPTPIGGTRGPRPPVEPNTT
jgi:hypothetical protein